MYMSEYGRAVHAEINGLLTCARNGVSPGGTTLFTTAFPCHNCTRHIIAAGVRRVVYFEPYPKSMARKLHNDAIELPGAERSKRTEGRNFDVVCSRVICCSTLLYAESRGDGWVWDSDDVPMVAGVAAHFLSGNGCHARKYR